LTRGDNTALSPDSTPIYQDREPDHLKPLLDEAGVERIIVVQAAETLGENFYTLGLARRYPFIAAVVGWVDPASPSIEEELLALTAVEHFRGVRPVRADNISIRWMADPALESGWRAIHNAGLVLEVLVQDPDELPVVTRLAETLPDLRIVLDHCGKPDIAGARFNPWAQDLGTLAELGNVHCKFSGLMNRASPDGSIDTIYRFAEHVVSVFGPDRIIWASDWPPLDLASSYAAWMVISRHLLGNLCPDRLLRQCRATVQDQIDNALASEEELHTCVGLSSERLISLHGSASPSAPPPEAASRWVS
jgi:L-fuconolactonase